MPLSLSNPRASPDVYSPVEFVLNVGPVRSEVSEVDGGIVCRNLEARPSWESKGFPKGFNPKFLVGHAM
jgi:hypothetical protein